MSVKETIETIESFIEIFSRGGWSIFKDHPTPAILVFLLGVIAAYLYYQERISILEQRISAYQERMGETPKETLYAKLTNKELKSEASKLVRRLQEFRQETKKEDLEQQRSFDEQMKVAQSEDDKKGIHQRFSQKMHESTSRQSQKFQREFVGAVRALSTEIRVRLPDLSKQADDEMTEIIIRSGWLGGSDPIGDVADNLEKFAGLLPSTSESWFLQRWEDNLFTFAIFTILALMILRQLAKCLMLRKSTNLTPTPPVVASQSKNARQKPPRYPRRAR